MVLLYIRPVNKPWYQPESSELPQKPTSNNPELELKKADSTKLKFAKNTEAIRNIQQIYHLERRLFV